MKLEAIQQALCEAHLDGWLFYDFHHRDLLAYRILGLDEHSLTTRRWFYLVPARGEPVRLSHRVEPGKLADLPGRQEFYLAWGELHDKLRKMLDGLGQVAMQYSPMNNIPYVSLVDAGTVELVRSFGVQVVSSADLVQRFESLNDEDGFRSHREAGARVHAVREEAFALMGSALRESRAISEYDVKEFILQRFEEEGLTSDGASPIVGFNDHPADPHFEPRPETAYSLHTGDTVLVDLWARRREPRGLYYDITWCGYAGQDPPALYREIFATVCEARRAAVDFVRRRLGEGIPTRGCEVDDVARKVVADAGYGAAFLHRTGHSIGTEVHGNGANIDNLETRDERLLVPGACFSIEPGIYLAGRMAVRTEVDVCITPGGEVEVVGPIQDELIRIG